MNKITGILIGILEIIMGVLVLIRPQEFVDFIFDSLGLVLIIIGIFSCVRYFKSNVTNGILSQALFNGILLIILGVFLLFTSGWLISILPLLSLIYGVIILIGSIKKIQISVDLKRLHHKGWLITLIEAIISIILVIIIFTDPFIAATTLWIFVGVSLIVEGIFNTISSIIVSFS